MIVANLATYPPRAHALGRVVASIAPQVDRLNVVLNEYDTVPVNLLDYDNVVPILIDRDLKDTGKFWPSVEDAEWVVLIDDDLHYPDDYVATTLARATACETPRAVYGYHGVYYRKPGLKRLKFWKYPPLAPDTVMRYRRVHTFWNVVERPLRVDQLGTGTVVLKSEHMPPFDFMETSQKFVDVRFALWAFQQDLACICLPRPREWLGVEEFEDTIYQFTQSNPGHVADEIWQYAYKTPDVGTPLRRSADLPPSRKHGSP
ncbi:hypothetical protein Dshi_2862 [Dinoroseobacter shibae DFL 12 = DSM 16493]|jgi:hypothetical protein|uniref:Glycosyltransferase 2-like domain-containing protein n=1 Tax=Dinoroseobacter shibae (strain DSM 16493 / NCIMB 14021 / DFL 12) TaxID=398580 RepID=A8LJJ2_DINSH|nr:MULTISPECIES: hypothetical protein [Dinoroseobacter]ABV94595.1 hypothetical protein Dshi_2862 [Dinoroseobacter shibae DFL 12 = DSM 16493]MDD9716962.1 hypothetical protein [Dinoroseobacter sp. PD6]URF46022.1 hypothetical protein M8008_14750 [Dinoroseobacter shibae]URF50328.1 hypothetical protein M8007_14750 [Dinoroseobacter shibae]